MNSSTENNSNKTEFDQNVDLLRAIPHFSELPLDTLKGLAIFAQRMNYQPGSPIFNQGDIDSNAYYIIEGEFEVVRTEGEREIILDSGDAGAFIGGFTLLTDMKRILTVRARTPMRCLVIPRKRFLEDITKHERGLEQYLRAVARDVTDWQDRFISQMLRANESPEDVGAGLT